MKWCWTYNPSWFFLLNWHHDEQARKPKMARRVLWEKGHVAFGIRREVNLGMEENWLILIENSVVFFARYGNWEKIWVLDNSLSSTGYLTKNFAQLLLLTCLTFLSDILTRRQTIFCRNRNIISLHTSKSFLQKLLLFFQVGHAI